MRTWYEICEWPGAELESFLKIASCISSFVTSVKGRSSSSLLVMSGLKSCSKAGGLVELFMNGFTLLFVGGGFWAVWAT